MFAQVSETSGEQGLMAVLEVAVPAEGYSGRACHIREESSLQDLYRVHRLAGVLCVVWLLYTHFRRHVDNLPGSLTAFRLLFDLLAGLEQHLGGRDGCAANVASELHNVVSWWPPPLVSATSSLHSYVARCAFFFSMQHFCNGVRGGEPLKDTGIAADPTAPPERSPTSSRRKRRADKRDGKTEARGQEGDGEPSGQGGVRKQAQGGIRPPVPPTRHLRLTSSQVLTAPDHPGADPAAALDGLPMIPGGQGGAGAGRRGDGHLETPLPDTVDGDLTRTSKRCKGGEDDDDSDSDDDDGVLGRESEEMHSSS
uniref:Uncharacterized protein n=1 Tax=Chromera velia CCMP2878 TaxID=1169474 RepID=A0A0G4H021_9ALVE|eukprot:Cvel_24134.t1-p1 / transcript=Cvel_24134.t1 / gene=Cvel_24134 / organism=Chromera_velia_CCMP2878 / gene_product=hypothetical protein / transcript_product=hypothetical protein / location=Cvel_scaffold2574:17157-21407(-) / protein_length=310 / sequence_SO=supercontig / SO=protein_coding / is_pseudo=false